jgi:hypothetical protein
VYRIGKSGVEPANLAEQFQVHNLLGKIDFDGLPECKIVKPKPPINIGKESQKIADMYDFGKKPESEAAGGKDEFMSYQDYRKSLIEINKIENADKILVGQAIRMRAGDFTWS